MSSRYLLATRFEDSANASIKDAEPPAAGVFRPFESLSNFVGKGMLGQWRLMLRDVRTGGGAGQLIRWGIEFQGVSSPARFADYTARFGSADLARYAFGLTPQEPPPTLKLSVDGDELELDHWRWPLSGDVSYRYEVTGGGQVGWNSIQPTLRDRQRYPGGLERWSVAVPAVGSAALIRAGVELVP